MVVKTLINALILDFVIGGLEQADQRCGHLSINSRTLTTGYFLAWIYKHKNLFMQRKHEIYINL